MQALTCHKRYKLGDFHKFVGARDIQNNLKKRRVIDICLNTSM